MMTHSWILLLGQMLLVFSKETLENFTLYDLWYVIRIQEQFCISTPSCATIVHPPPPLSENLNENGSTILTPFDLVSRIHPTPLPFNDGTCCGDCSCEIEFCTYSGTCCPSLLDYLPRIEESASKIRIECDYASLKRTITPIVPLGLSIWMFTRCAESFSGEPLTKEKCENPDEFLVWETKVPVTDRETFMTYQNIFCALCNDVSEENIVNWDASVRCSSSIVMPVSKDTIVEAVNAADDCNIIYDLPQIGMILPECDLVQVSACNMTGRWDVYDSVIEAACHAYSSVFKQKYKNIFCFLCNEPVTSLPAICFSQEGKGIPFSFSALLRFTASEEENIVHAPEGNAISICKDSQILDHFKNVCRNLHCMPPKTLRSGRCSDTVEYLTGVHYEAFLKLTPEGTSPSILDLDELELDVWNIYHGYFESFDLMDRVFEQALYYQMMLHNDSYIQCFVLKFRIYFGATDKMSTVFINSLLSMGKSSKTFNTENTETHKRLRMTLDFYDINLQNETLIHSLGNYSNHLQFIRTVVPPFVDPPNFTKTTEPILVTKILDCPLIDIDSRDYSIEMIGEKYIYITELDSVFGPDVCTIKNLSARISVTVCAENIISEFTVSVGGIGVGSTPLSNDSTTTQGLVSLICTCISLLCLILTLVSYSLFEELRTQPGVNNMALVICLIIAQALFQFGANQASSVVLWACEAIGVLIHFFWLMVLFWMNICCIHMCRVFAMGKITVTARLSTKSTVIYIVYTVASSVSFVLINVLVSLCHSDFQNIGYGGKLCYITDYKMTGYVFALPVGCVVVFNLAIFVLVVIKIWRTPAVKSDTKHSRNLFAVYAKLSSLTGITWIFGFIYFFAEVVVLEYIFILLNATQGVFIFVSFVCNRRVLRNCLDMIHGRKSTQWNICSSENKRRVDTELIHTPKRKNSLAQTKQ